MIVGENMMKSNEELKFFIQELKRDLFNLRFQKVAGTLKDVSQLKKKRKEIANILMLLKQRSEK